MELIFFSCLLMVFFPPEVSASFSKNMNIDKQKMVIKTKMALTPSPGPVGLFSLERMKIGSELD